MASIIVFFLLFILPFIIAPFGITQFENPKVIFAEAGIIVLFLFFLFTTTIALRKRTTLVFLYSIIILLTVIDLIFFRTSLSFFGNAFRMQGIFLLWMLLLFSFLSSQGSFKNISPWVYIFLLFIETVVIFFLPLNASQRYVGTLGEPNALAGFAIFLWPFGWFGLKNSRWEIVGKILLLVFAGIILYVSGSRSGMIAFGIELLFICLQTIRLSTVKTVIICLLFYFASYAFPFFEHVPYENRAEVWQSAFYAGMINPGIGQGFGNTEIALHNAAAGINLPIQYYYVDSSHNIFLDWWVQGGVIGVSILLIVVYVTFVAFIKQNKKRELVLLLGMVTVLSFNPVSVVESLGFWWIIGQGELG